MWYFLTSSIGPTVEWPGKEKMDSGYYYFMFFVGLAACVSPLYMWIDSGTGNMTDVDGKYPKIFTLTGICIFCMLHQWAYRIYFFARRREMLRIAPNFLNGRNTIQSIHWYLYVVNAVGFIAIMIGALIALYVPDSSHNDLASYFLLVSGIFILITSLFVFMGRNLEVHNRGVRLMTQTFGNLIDTDGRKRNFSSRWNLGEITPAGQILTLEAKKITLTPEMVEAARAEQNGARLSSFDGHYVDNNTHEAIFLSAAKKLFGHDNVRLRQFRGDIYAMPTDAASRLDVDMLQTLDNPIKPHVIHPTSSRVYQNIVELPPAGETEEELLNPKSFSSGGTSKLMQTKNGFISLVRNFDYLETGYFGFTQTVFKSYGIGIHINFTQSLVVPYVFFMLPMNTYLLTNSLYGLIMWAITTWVPFHVCIRNTLSHFWDMHTHMIVIGWASIAFATGILNNTQPNTPTYIYSNATWSNDDIGNGICFPGCTTLDDSTTYWWECFISFVLSIFYFFYEISVRYQYARMAISTDVSKFD